MNNNTLLNIELIIYQKMLLTYTYEKYIVYVRGGL